MAQKCSYSRFENFALVSEGLEKNSSHLKDISGLPKKPTGSESHRPDNAAISHPGHSEPTSLRQVGETVQQESSLQRMDSETLADPALPERTKDHGDLAMTNSHPSCKSDCYVAATPLQQNKGWYNVLGRPWQMKPLWTIAGGPYEAKRIHQKYMYRNTRPW